MSIKSPPGPEDKYIITQKALDEYNEAINNLENENARLKAKIQDLKRAVGVVIHCHGKEPHSRAENCDLCLDHYTGLKKALNGK